MFLQRIFWRYDKAFISKDFIIYATKQFFVFPLAVGLPVYAVIKLSSGYQIPYFY